MVTAITNPALKQPDQMAGLAQDIIDKMSSAFEPFSSSIAMSTR